MSGVPISGYGNSDIGYNIGYNIRVSILGYGNSDIRYNIGYNIGYPDIGIPISDMISGVPTKHP
jgi:hypothetical protein